MSARHCSFVSILSSMSSKQLDGIALFISRAGLPDRQGEKMIKMNHTYGSPHHSWLPTEGSASYEDVNRSSSTLSTLHFRQEKKLIYNIFLLPGNKFSLLLL